MSKKPEKELLRALLKMQEDFKHREEKYEREQWKKVNPPYDLATLLAPLTKGELSTIRQNLSIGGMSSLKKGELISALTKAIPEHFAEQLHSFDGERYGFISDLAAHRQLEVDGAEYTYSQIQYFRSLGLVFSIKEGKQKFLVLPDELADLYAIIDHSEILESVHRNTEWIRLTLGMLYYYGHMDTIQLANYMGDLTEEKINVREFLEVINRACRYYEQMNSNYYDGYDYDHVIDKEKVSRAHVKNRSISFYPYSKNQLLQAGTPGFVHHSPCMDLLFSILLDHYVVPDEEAERLQIELIDVIRNTLKIDAVMAYLQASFEFPSREIALQISELAEEAMKEIPRWELKGYTPEEWDEMK